MQRLQRRAQFYSCLMRCRHYLRRDAKERIGAAYTFFDDALYPTVAEKVSSFGVNDRRSDISVESVATYNQHLPTAQFVELKITAAGVNDWLCVQQFHL